MKFPPLRSLCVAGPSDHLHIADFVPLFNGEDLEGWEQHGGKAEYRGEDGMIVGKTVANAGNSLLCSRKTYGDFVLEFELKVAPGMIWRAPRRGRARKLRNRGQTEISIIYKDAWTTLFFSCRQSRPVLLLTCLCVFLWKRNGLVCWRTLGFPEACFAVPRKLWRTPKAVVSFALLAAVSTQLVA